MSKKWFGPKFNFKYEKEQNSDKMYPVVGPDNMCGCCGCPYIEEDSEDPIYPHKIKFYNSFKSRPILKVEVEGFPSSLRWVLGKGYNEFVLENLDLFNGTYFYNLPYTQYGCIPVVRGYGGESKYIGSSLGDGRAITVIGQNPLHRVRIAQTSFYNVLVSPGTQNSPAFYRPYFSSEEEAREKCENPHFNPIYSDGINANYPLSFIGNPYSSITVDADTHGVNRMSASWNTPLLSMLKNITINININTSYSPNFGSNTWYRAQTNFGAIKFINNKIVLNPGNNFYSENDIGIDFVMDNSEYQNEDYKIYWDHSLLVGWRKEISCGNPTYLYELENFSGKIKAQIIEAES